MPRKTNGMKFKLLPRPTKGENGKKLLYVQPAINVKFTIRTLDKFCVDYHNKRPGDLINMFECFMLVAAEYMKTGARIDTPIGSFVPKLKLDGDYTNPDDVKGENVRFDTIKFTPSKRFKKELSMQLIEGFVQEENLYHPHVAENETEEEEALQKSLQPGYATVNSFAHYSGYGKMKARRFLESLCKGGNPRLTRYKEGQTIQYRLIKKCQEKE